MNTDTPNWHHTLALEIQSGKYTGSSLALALQTELQFAEPDHHFVCIYNPATGSITIRSETILLFNTLTDYQVMNSTVTEFILWKNKLGIDVYVDLHSLKSLHEVIRHSNNSEYHPLTTSGVSSFETGFTDLLNVHNIYIYIYIHSSNSVHYSSIGVRGENTIIKKVIVTSSFGYLIMDSVVAPHDKIDASRQLIKTMNFTLKNVHGNVIDLHAANVSFSMIFVTID